MNTAAADTLPVQVDRGSGPVIVLLHGLGTNHASWSFVLKHLDSSVRVIAFDLLGFGDAPKPNSTYTPKMHAEAVIRTLKKFNIDHAVIAGHSMGCVVAVEIAAQYPDLVRHLVLAGAPIYEHEPKHRWLPIQNVYFSIFKTIKNHPEATKLAGTLAKELAPFVKGMEITDETWPAFRSSLEHTIIQYETPQQLKQLEVPTLLLNGILDFFIIHRVNRHVARTNRRYLRTKTVLGPHELTPHSGRSIARVLRKLAAAPTVSRSPRQ